MHKDAWQQPLPPSYRQLSDAELSLRTTSALESLGINARYTRLHLRPEEVAEAFRLLDPQGRIGVNCTIPHKPAALTLVAEVDVSAKLAGGVNTVRVRRDGPEWVDGPG